MPTAEQQGHGSSVSVYNRYYEQRLAGAYMCNNEEHVHNLFQQSHAGVSIRWHAGIDKVVGE